jgi:uncharacterized protein (TIGR02284 family)
VTQEWPLIDTLYLSGNRYNRINIVVFTGERIETMTDQRIVKSLASLHAIVDASEKGYAVAALNLKNPGLKVLFKTFAQQRARFRQEIQDELKRLGAATQPRISFRGVVHRGRINIFATLIIEADEREKMVLSEVLLGESVAKKTYEKTLKKELPPETRAVLERQYRQVQAVVDQVHLLRGKNGKRQLVFLYDSEKDIEKIYGSLRQAGFPAETVERVTLADFAEKYQPKGRPVFDAVLSGAVGGLLWGSLIGSLAGLGAMQSTGVDPLLVISPANVWALVAILGIVGGAVVGAILGFFIGLGVSEEDTYQYEHSMQHGRAIVRILIDEARAREAGHILSRAHLEPVSQTLK